MNSKDKNSNDTALHSAVQNGEKEVTGELIKAGAEVNQRNGSGDTH